nr:integrase, catalytic region, zinc finger, CCHC-type, peptidase aspartic, catalytic [Tanacetum cinerariifolium]
MEQAVEQHRVESKGFQVKMNKVLNKNERLLEQAISKDIVNIVVTSTVNNACEPVHECERCVKLKTELQTGFIKRKSYDKLFKQYTTLEKHCISLESQEKDMVIKKLKERIKSLSGNIKKEKIKQELEEIKTINIELNHKVTKLIAENKHLKQTYKQLYDSIKSSRIRSKEQCDGLIKRVNIKSAKNSYLNGSLKEKVLVITAHKDTLRKLNGKAVVDEATVPRTPQQNDIVARRNHTLIEAARTMLIFFKALMFLWAEAVATACYTQNRSLIHTRHNKTPYELVHNKKLDLTFFRVFCALCYPINDIEDLGKLQPQLILEYSLVKHQAGKLMFDEYLEPPRVERPVSPAPAVQAPVNSVGTPSSTTTDQDAPYLSISPSSSALQSHSLHQGVAAESPFMKDNPAAPVDNNPIINVFAPEPSSDASSSEDVSSTESTNIS